MCNLMVKRICLVLLVCFAFVNTEVTIENGGYSVLVSFSQNVKSTEGMQLLQKMRESLENSSVILNNAIGLQFTKVIFLLPESWNISQMNINIDNFSVKNYSKADFLIDDTNDVIFGKFPFAQQYGSCGIPGHQITIPTAFFSDANKFPRGLALAREWLKYRYGVFDENGYEEDPLYPLYRFFPQDENSELRVTDCTNYPVTYLTDQSETFSRTTSLDSKLVPEEKSLENVTSSIMYFHQDIPGMQYICGKNSDHEHNALSPNKHNAMCRGQSIWEVVGKSEDFRAEFVPKEYSDIEFIYAQEKRLKVVIAWENTANINKSKGEFILNAIKRFVYELPQGTKFNGFPFSNTLSSGKDYTLKQLNDLSDKNAIMTNIKSDFVKVSDGNITIAVHKALEILSSDSSNSEPEGTIIIISKSGKALSNTLLETILRNDVYLKILSLNEGNTSDKTEYYTSALPIGFQEDISTDNNEHMFNQLFASMESVLPLTVDDKITETVKTGYLSQDDSITFQVDETVEKVTFWIFNRRESENFEMKLNGVNEKFQEMKTTDIMALWFHPSTKGIIEISYPHPTDPIFTQVRTTFKAGKYLNGFILIRDTAEMSSDQQMPVIIYAVVKYGAYPVQNAKVTARVERPNENNTILEMFDDGKGDPDITQNDGVYSRYFTQFSEKGEYIVNVEVEITDSTSYGVDENADFRTCCGSFLKTVSSKIPESKKIFKRFFSAKSGRPDAGYKPSRISDLRVDDVLDDKIVLKWSAPGEEGDSGTVHSYEIKLYTSYGDAMKGENEMALNYTITPLERGETQTLELKFSVFKASGRYYITIIAKNEKAYGDASPILEIFVPDIQTTTTPDDKTDDTNDDGSAKTAGNEKKKALIIGLIVGVILLLILIIVVVYFVLIKPKRKEAKANPTSDVTERGENHVINPINFVSADTLIRHHNVKTLARMENKEPPIFREEDFEDRESSQTPESLENNNIQQHVGLDKTVDNKECLPPKSPKKTTYV